MAASPAGAPLTGPAFSTLPLADHVLANLNPRRFAVQALVLCPTRELAEQVSQEIRRLAQAEDNVKVLTLCGGTTMRPQLASLAHGAHVVVAPKARWPSATRSSSAETW